MRSDYEVFLKNMPSSYLSTAEKNWEFIDKIDLVPYINKYEDLYDMMCKMEEDFEKEVGKEEYLDGYLFNTIPEDEFSTYIRNKYSVSYREEYTIKYIKCPNNKKIIEKVEGEDNGEY